MREPKAPGVGTKFTISATMLQLSNIARDVQREPKLNPKNGHVLDHPEAMKSWSRKYESGWAPKV